MFDTNMPIYEILDNAIYNLETAIRFESWDMVAVAKSQIQNVYDKMMEVDD